MTHNTVNWLQVLEHVRQRCVNFVFTVTVIREKKVARFEILGHEV